MAFTQGVITQTIIGSMRLNIGWYNASGVTTGTINTGLQQVTAMQLQGSGGSVVADDPTVNTTDPTFATPQVAAVPIIVTSGSQGLWFAYGY